MQLDKGEHKAGHEANRGCVHFRGSGVFVELAKTVYTPYMTIYLVILQPKISYVQRIYMVLATPAYFDILGNNKKSSN